MWVVIVVMCRVSFRLFYIQIGCVSHSNYVCLCIIHISLSVVSFIFVLVRCGDYVYHSLVIFIWLKSLKHDMDLTTSLEGSF